MFLATGANSLHSEGQCVLGRSERALSMCSNIVTLAAISVFSGLILSVTQGMLSVLCGSCGGCSCVELVGRGLVAAAWLITAILTTILGAKDGKRADSSGWCYTTVALCWVMLLLSIAMVIAAIVRMAANTCNPALGQGSCLVFCAEILCLTWLVKRIAEGSASSQGYTLYTPMPGGPGQERPGRSRNSVSASQYHEHLMHAHVPVTVVHPVSEPFSSASFFGMPTASDNIPTAPPLYPSFRPTMTSPFGQGGQAVGVPVAPTPQQPQYPNIYPSLQQQQQQQYPPPMPISENSKDEPSAPPIPTGKR